MKTECTYSYVQLSCQDNLPMYGMCASLYPCLPPYRYGRQLLYTVYGTLPLLTAGPAQLVYLHYSAYATGCTTK